MSKVKIQGNASGTGTLTISAPNTNVDRSLTLPDGAGEILTSSSTLSSSNLSGALPALDGSALTGISQTVKQYVRGQTTTNLALSTTTYTSIGLSATITPSSTSSKILIFLSLQYQLTQAKGVGIGIYDGSNWVHLSNTYYELYHGGGTSGERYDRSSWIELDSPATTSAVTYTVYAASYNNGSVQFQVNNHPSQILLLEV